MGENRLYQKPVRPYFDIDGFGSSLDGQNGQLEGQNGVRDSQIGGPIQTYTYTSEFKGPPVYFEADFNAIMVPKMDDLVIKIMDT